MRRQRIPVSVAMFVLGGCALGVQGAEPEPLVFSRDVRPILADKCYACHGPDAERREAGLRLDRREAALSKLESGRAAIVPRHMDASELVARIESSEADRRMPPPDSGKSLTDAQRAILRRWITEGASYEEHWAYIAPKRPGLPEVKNSGWVRNPIDRFVLARLEAQGLAPSPPADPITLLRRLQLDLVGLPPSLAQIDAWRELSAEQRNGDGWRNTTQQLLDSPHYGERWARHWLDAARYADSDGFEKDKSRQVSFYRDWVIQSLNRDLGYDQFVIEQLAGDQLPNASQDQIVATGFLRNSMINEEGGVDPEQFRMDAMFDRMDAIGKSILGLTIQCAQCHAHKYDPLTQEEYYRLFAFLNNDHEAQRVVYSPDELRQVADLSRRMREIDDGLRSRLADWRDRVRAWEAALPPQPAWTTLKLENAGDNGQRYIPQPDGSLLAQGYAPTKFTAVFRATTNLQGITALRLELLTDPNLPCQGPGRSFKGTSALSEITVEVATAAEPDKKTKLKIVEATSDVNPAEKPLEPNFDDKTTTRRVTGPAAFAIDGNGNTAWGIDVGPGRRNQPRKAVFRLEAPIALTGELILTISLQQNHGGWNSDDHMNHNLGRFRISATNGAGILPADPLPSRIREILAKPEAERSPAQVEALFTAYREQTTEFKAENDQLEALWQAWPAGSTALTLQAREQPRETKLLQRGDWLKPTRGVQPGVPAFLHALPADAAPTRLAFARWLVDPRSPTTARVIVNRVWQSYFGQGLVATSEDFGVQSEPPSHPELLDWLAVELMENRWSLKHLHQLIVDSATYRQSSRLTPELAQRDPLNRWLARGPRLRVEGEIVRDIALAASGLLNPQVGGRSVMPPAPEFLFQPPASYAPFPWMVETGPEKYRRAIYTFRRRSTPFPMLQTFDVPNGDASCVRRQRSNSPLQALVALNEPLFVECAQSLARLALERGGASDAERIRFAFRQVLSRAPDAVELTELQRLLDQQRRRIEDGCLPATQIATGKLETPRELPANATPTQWAALTIVCRAILNLDEAITKE